MSMSKTKWSIDLSKWADKAKRKTRLIFQKVAMEAFGRIILRSPVKTGRFRANWGCSIGSPYYVTYDLVDEEGNTTRVKMQQIVAKWDGTDKIYLLNHLPYGPKLEFGSSQQSPQGMVRITVAEMGGVISRVAKE